MKYANSVTLKILYHDKLSSAKNIFKQCFLKHFLTMEVKYFITAFIIRTKTILLLPCRTVITF